jgi:hypothetical protein
VNELTQFLKAVYESIDKRRDSYVELGLALASSEYVESIVSLSKSHLYRRGFGSVYDTLSNVKIDETSWLQATRAMLRACCEQPEGVVIFSGDSTFVKRRAAVTLPERCYTRSRTGELLIGQQSYWTHQLVASDTSWCGVVKAERMNQQSVTEMAAKHLQLIDQQANGKQLYVLDAGHGKAVLAGYRECQHSDVVMRVKGNQVFYDKPAAYSGRGRPALHGACIKLAAMPEPITCSQLDYRQQNLRVQVWTDLHYQGYADIHGRILRLDFLDEQGKPRHSAPIWLFTTNTDLAPELLAKAYLGRANHELTFRFLKQHLALTAVQSPALKHVDAHLRLVGFAMNLLLASRAHLQPKPDPWYPRQVSLPISQRQAQKQALAFFLNVPNPTQPPRPAGKAKGRPTATSLSPRPRFDVARKTPKRYSPCPRCPLQT